MFRLSKISTWRSRHLLAAWAAWWLGLAAVTLGPIAVGAWRVQRGAEEGAFTISLSVDDGTVSVTLADAASTLWSAAAGTTTIALWIALPPLLLWGLWLWRSRRRLGESAPVHAAQPRHLESRAAPVGDSVRSPDMVPSSRIRD